MPIKVKKRLRAIRPAAPKRILPTNGHAVRVLVGLMGGSFYGPQFPSGQGRYYVNYSIAAISGMGFMRLAADGVTPQGPDGVALTPGGGEGPQLDSYYKDGMAAMAAAAPDDTWDVQFFPYDWRQSNLLWAQKLANTIVAEVEGRFYQDFTLVGHSQGGVVARAAWAYLNQMGKASYIRRIVTLGTPHFGLNCAPLTIMGASPQLRELAERLAILGFPHTTTVLNQRRFLVDLARTFPAFYELFPQPQSRQQPPLKSMNDLLDQSLYYFSSTVRANWMEAIQSFATFMNTPANIPPPSVMVHIVSNNLPTPWQCYPQQNSTENAPVYSTVNGDGTVAFEDQSLPGYSLTVYNGVQHSALFNVAATDPVLEDLVYSTSPPPPSSSTAIAYNPPPSPLKPWPDFALPFMNGQGPGSIKPGYVPSPAQHGHDC